VADDPDSQAPGKTTVGPGEAWLCQVQGFPVPPVPPAVYIAGEDLTRPDGTIVCRSIGSLQALRIAAEGIRIITRLIELVP
jgi:hypothetical protein